MNSSIQSLICVCKVLPFRVSIGAKGNVCYCSKSQKEKRISLSNIAPLVIIVRER